MTLKERLDVINEIKGRLAVAREAYEALAKKYGPVLGEIQAAVNRTKTIQNELAAALVVGANPCPSCGGAPHGMVQPTRDGMGYEVGCPRCTRFEHADGSVRDHAARGPLPHHAVEAWNAGPDYWKRRPNDWRQAR